MRAIAVARQERLAALAGFLQRLGAPRPQLPALQMAPQIRVQHEVLQITVEVRMGLRNHEGTKMPTVATRSGMHVEEAEDFRLGIAEGVEDRAGIQLRFPADRPPSSCPAPIRVMMARGHSEFLVQLAADGAYRSIAHHGQSRVDVHARHESGFRPAGAVHPLVAQTDAGDAPAGRDSRVKIARERHDGRSAYAMILDKMSCRARGEFYFPARCCGLCASCGSCPPSNGSSASSPIACCDVFSGAASIQ